MKYILEERFILNEAAGDKDWATLIKEAQDAGNQTKVNNLWDQYYTEEWGADKQHAEALGEALKIELTNISFSEAVNPFISFVKTLFGKGIYPDSNIYGTIHNAYNRHYVSNQMLKGTDLLGKQNIIFNKSLYDANSADVQDYLNYWHTAIGLAKTKEINLEAGELKEKSYVNAETKKITAVSEYITDLFFTPGSTEVASAKGDPEKELRPINKIKDAILLDFNEKSVGDDNKVNTNAQKIADDFVKGDKERAKAAISYIAKMKLKTTDAMRSAIATATNNDFKISVDQELAFAGWLNSNNLSLTLGNLTDALNSIGKSAGLIS